MPELHQLTPTLTILQKRGFKVGLVTDGRMSGASGKVAAAIHVVPEAKDGGLISKIRSGDFISMNAITGELVCIDPQVEKRPARIKDNSAVSGLGRELFANMRTLVTSSEEGASFL
jgi:phosphogluconate dehydratase